jgi:hypothetical protein
MQKLPLEVDEATQDLEELRRASAQDRTKPANPPTTMTTIVHLIRLKRLESEIQHKLYRVDKTKPADAIYETTDRYLEKLQAWRDAIPAAVPQCTGSRASIHGDDYRTYDSYVCHKSYTLDHTC